uniref:C1q domain-containing protein n=1 Tax=Knipowitschia caucasica TaxID=637954 RepID=A0AAV2LW13_KNICA
MLSGFFIAPVKGAYHFEFYIGSHGTNHNSAAALVKNGEHVVIAHERSSDGHSNAANGATLLLEAGDVLASRHCLCPIIRHSQTCRKETNFTMNGCSQAQGTATFLIKGAILASFLGQGLRGV